jgi:hypothetical protein
MTTQPAPASGATTVTSQGVAASPIPFRKTAASGPEVFGVLVTTVLVLAAFAALAVFARRRGWLDRWVGQAPLAADNKRRLAVVETLRISRKTTLYRVRNGDSEFLLAESSAPLQLSSTTIGSEPTP